MQSEPIGKLFWRYTLPAVMGMVVQGLYSLIDGIFIGQSVGAAGLAAINIAWPVFAIIVGIGLMVGTGTAALYSIAKGAGEKTVVRQILGNAFVLMPLLSIPLILLMYNFGQKGLLLQGAEGEVLMHGSDYLHYLALGALPAMAGAALPMLIRNDEHPKLATGLMCLGACANVVLDWVFVVMLKQGVGGAAIATVLSQSLITVLGVAHFFSYRANDRLSLKDLSLNFKISRETLITGFSSLMMFLYLSFVLIIHNRLFMEYGNVMVVAAFAIVGYVQAFYYMFAEGVGHGIQPLVSFNKGANNNQNIREALLMAFKVVIGSGLAALLFINLFPQLIANIFTGGKVALNEVTITGLRLHLFTMFLDGFIVVSAAYFQSLAIARLATFISIGNMLVQLPLLWLLPKWLGVTGIWIAMPISNIFLAAVVVVFIIQDLRKRSVAGSPVLPQELQQAA